MSAKLAGYCIACGYELVTGAAFCSDCGHQVGAVPAAQPAAGYDVLAAAMGGCSSCGGDGSYLSAELVYCPECRWLRPLGDDYFLEIDAFMWQMDAQAMNVLNSLGPLASAAHGIAERYGRPVFEAATNGIRLSERQMPEIFEVALRSARLMSLPHMPEVYISGERMWDVYSLGGYGGSFVSIGSVLINFKPADLMFLVAREMGHIRAGHVFRTTAMQFLKGKSRGQATILGEGVLQFLNPAKLVESAIEAPLMRWARHSEITADRAATLITGDLSCARRVLTQWAMKSFPVTGKLNLGAWLEQEAAADDPYLRLSELTMSTTPYLAPRLKILSEFSAEEGFGEWRSYICHWYRSAGLEETPTPPKPTPPTERISCAACGERMRVPTSVLAGDQAVNVRCPNTECRKVLRVKPKPPRNAAADSLEARTRRAGDKARLVCVACREPMYVDRGALTGDVPVNVRCPNAACGEILTVRPKPKKQHRERPDLTTD
jgi:Zn-dependent protease with chaperone function